MKRFDVYLTPSAVKDLEFIYDHVAEESGFPQRAWAFVEKLRHKCTGLGLAPVCGQRRDDLLEGLRIAPLDKKVLAAFTVDEEKGSVLVLAIFHDSRDYEAFFVFSDINAR